MRYVLSLIILCAGCAVLFFSCAKWVDKKAVDPHLTNPYCNDPRAVNYNWGFPGRPDDSVCFFPDDLFKGKYIYQDSIYLPDNTYLFSRAETLSIYGLSDTLIGMVGMCPSLTDTLKLSAATTYIATVDTVVGYGQLACRPLDTLAGTLTKLYYNDTVMLVYFTVNSDTGITIHKGQAYKQY
jgi:hypothetical protein